MTLEDLLKEDNARVELYGRWLTWWGGVWVVQDRQYYARNNRVLYSGDSIEEAITKLQG